MYAVEVSPDFLITVTDAVMVEVTAFEPNPLSSAPCPLPTAHCPLPTAYCILITMLPTIEWKGDAVVMIDQRKLPASEVYVTCRTAHDVAKAIKTMVIRGAPAIGVSAAMGIALGMSKSRNSGTKAFTTEFQRTCELLASTRPTAVNLFWAIARMQRCFAEAAQAGQSVDEIKAHLIAESAAIHDEDVASCRAIGAFGASLVPDEATILTHCNAGALATAGYGTALGVIRGAVEQGKRVVVLADETRPFLQGARLTAWELVKDGIDTTVITDNMAGTIMKNSRVDLVVVGADRIAANGDVANKVGTYTVAVLAREHGIPFYVAAPISTVDLATPDGTGIPIEERPSREVTHVGTNQLTPAGASIRNPAFDVTPAKYIAAIVTDRGIARPPFTESLAALVAGSVAPALS
jgi:methylthioribose-1-phosphate isomerase